MDENPDVVQVWAVEISTYSATVGITPEVSSLEEAKERRKKMLDRAKKNGGGVKFKIKTRLVTEWEDA